MNIRRRTIIPFLFLIMLSIPLSVSAQTHVPSENGASQGDLVSRMALLVFQVSLIIFAAFAGGKLFEKMKLPSVLGEILTGTLIGPYLLGSIPLPGFPSGMFPIHGDFPISAELYSLTALASILLLFLVGLETDIDVFMRYSVAGSLVGLGGVVFSFLLGDFAVVMFSQTVFGTHYGFFHPVAVMMGVLSTATSVGITARILSERKKMDSPEGITIISAAVIDDVLGIIILALTISVISSGHVEWTHILVLLLKALGIWIGFTVLGLTFGSKLSEFLKKSHDKSVITSLSFAFALLIAGVFEKSGLAMIVGAYVMGLTFSKTDLSLMIRENLSVLYRFLVPLFFCVMGMLVDLREMLSAKVLMFSAVYIVFCIVGKLIGCGLPGMMLGFNALGNMRIGAGMVPRGEVALIIAGICISMGILPQEYFSVAIVMTFFTTLLSPPMLSALFNNPASGVSKDRFAKVERTEIEYTMPNEATGEFILSKILEAFEDEGFYIHLYDIREKLYQMRKRKEVITMKFAPTTIIFFCSERDAAFIHTLFYEVLVEAERVMMSLEKLTDKKVIGRRIFSSATERHKDRVPFEHIINPAAVKRELEHTDKQGILEEMVDLLVRSGKLRYERKSEVLKDLTERESLMSTGMQDGIAIPHAKTSAIDHLVCALGIKKEGVDFDSLDKKSSVIFVLIVTPKDSSAPYLQFMAELSKVLREEKNRKALLECTTNDGLYDTFSALMKG